MNQASFCMRYDQMVQKAGALHGLPSHRPDQVTGPAVGIERSIPCSPTWPSFSQMISVKFHHLMIFMAVVHDVSDVSRGQTKFFIQHLFAQRGNQRAGEIAKQSLAHAARSTKICQAGQDLR